MRVECLAQAHNTGLEPAPLAPGTSALTIRRLWRSENYIYSESEAEAEEPTNRNAHSLLGLVISLFFWAL